MYTRLYFERQTFNVLLGPLVGNFVISSAAAFHITCLKFPVSAVPPDKSTERRNRIKRSSSSALHLHFSSGAFLLVVACLDFFSLRGSGASGSSLVCRLLVELHVCMRWMFDKKITDVTLSSHSSCLVFLTHMSKKF